MVAAVITTAATPAPYTVTRAMCIGGERVEVGTTVDLARPLATELMAAGKVAPYVEPVAAPETEAPSKVPKSKASDPMKEPE
jgi:hypothetical protein